MEVGVAITRQKEWHPNTWAQKMSRVLRGCVDDGQEYLYSLTVKTEEGEAKKRRQDTMEKEGGQLMV